MAIEKETWTDSTGSVWPYIHSAHLYTFPDKMLLEGDFIASCLQFSQTVLEPLSIKS